METKEKKKIEKLKSLNCSLSVFIGDSIIPSFLKSGICPSCKRDLDMERKLNELVEAFEYGYEVWKNRLQEALKALEQNI